MKEKLHLIGICGLLSFALLLNSQSASAQSRGLNGDGINDRVSVPHSPSLNVENSFTVECWFNTNELLNETVLVEKGRWVGNWLFFIKPKPAEGTKICLASWAWGPVELWGTTDLQTDTWYHFAATWDGTTRKVYLNGVLEAQDIPSGDPIGNTDVMGVGAASGGTYEFNGTIDDVRIWNYVRTPSEIASSYAVSLSGPQPGLVLHYQFQEGVSFGDNTALTTINDLSGTGNNGTLTNYARIGCTSNYVCGAPALGGVCITSGILTPTLPDLTSACAFTIPTATTTDACMAITINGTTGDPLFYDTPGAYVVNWTFDDGSGNTTTASQNVTVGNGPGLINGVETPVVCNGETAAVEFEISGGVGPYTYDFGGIQSGLAGITDTVWASSVIEYSTQYTTGSWAAMQALGAPDTYPTYGDIPSAWASAGADNQREYLVLGFAPTFAQNVLSYETFAVGAVDTVYVRQVSTGTWITIFTTTAAGGPSAAVIQQYPIPTIIGEIDAVRLAINSPAVGSWNEIDAIGLEVNLSTVITISGLAAGSYNFTLTDDNGCPFDSTFVITEPAEIIVDQVAVLCPGESITVGTNTYSTTGVYTDLLVAVNGCDSTVNTNLTINPDYSVAQTINICNGETYVIGASSYTTAGTYVDVLSSVFGCDSTVTTTLNVLPVYSNTQTLTICDNESVTVGSNTYTVSGTYVDVLTAMNGCDSTVTTNLTVNPVLTTAQNVTLCEGESVTVGSNTYTASGVYTDVLTALTGCDSTVTTTVDAVGTIDVSTSVTGITITANATLAAYQWIDCNNAGAEITGETNSVFTPSANGSYAVVISYGSCSDTSNCVTISTIGINENQGIGVRVYPNPGNGNYLIDLSAGAHVVVTNAAGQTILERNFAAGTSSLSIEDCADGIYFMTIQTNTFTQTQKLIKR
ncbi:MAG: T9SS type A sorting domain-containing protein [Bacteroidetes bacterium]|nr:T9SS type A sorting domain-containing protein [Bacteroidota bacterium]